MGRDRPPEQGYYREWGEGVCVKGLEWITGLGVGGGKKFPVTMDLCLDLGGVPTIVLPQEAEVPSASSPPVLAF